MFKTFRFYTEYKKLGVLCLARLLLSFTRTNFFLLLSINLPYDSIGAAVHFLCVFIFKTVFECTYMHIFNKTKDNSLKKVFHSK